MLDKDKICAAIIVKDETDYLKEWLDYHLGIGFDKIFLAINDDEGLSKYPYLKDYKGKLVVYNLAGCEAMQKPFYNCIINNEDYKWCAFIDTDEFISFRKDSGFTNIKDFLNSAPAEVEAYKLNWELYGDDGQVYYEDRPVVERFTKPLPPIYNTYNFGEQCHTKTILRKIDTRPRRIKFIANPHVVVGCNYYLTNGEPTDASPFNFDTEKSVVYIKHFYTKTIEEWVKHKLGRSYADYERSENIDYYPISTFFKYNERTPEKLKFLKEHGIEYPKQSKDKQ